MPDQQQVSRLPMHVVVASRLRDMIVDGRLAPGTRINEKKLADFLDVSRTPLREALKILQGEGLIEIETHRGTRVTHITPEHTAELFEALAGVERSCGELTTRKIDDDRLQRFHETHQEMFDFHRQGNRQSYFALNDRIHRGFVELSGNSIFIDFHAKLIVGARRIRFTAIKASERWDESVAEHQAILEAMTARAAERTGMLIEQHVRKTGEFVLAQLDRR